MAPTIPDEAPRPPLQDAQVRTPIAYQVHDAAAQAVEALRAPAQTAASTTSGFWSNFWGLQGSQRLPSNATPPGSAAIGVQGDSTSFDPDPRSRAENPGLGQIKASGYDFQPAPPRQEVSTAPFFHDVPDRALSGILPSDDVDSKALWKALEESMPYLNRRRRKALHRASNWIVHLFAGPGSHKAFKRLESQESVVVELDICRSRSQDLYHDPLWRLLVKVAKLGRVATVIGGPPSRT